jgi:hypothetical protein
MSKFEVVFEEVHVKSVIVEASTVHEALVSAIRAERQQPVEAIEARGPFIREAVVEGKRTRWQEIELTLVQETAAYEEADKMVEVSK